MLNDDQEKFIQKVNEISDLIVDYKGVIVSKEDILNSNRGSFFIKPQHITNVCDESGFVDEIRSDVIHFLRSISVGKHIQYGRLWFEQKYYDASGNVATKEKWLSDKFNIYKKWISKNYRKSKDFDFYIGEATYKLYKSGEYKMMATPVTEVEFE